MQQSCGVMSYGRFKWFKCILNENCLKTVLF